MRTTLSLFTAILLAASLGAQGQAFYIPDNISSAGTCNVIPWGTTASSATWANQRYQQIATSADLGGTRGFVTGIGFAPCGTGIHRSQTLRITLAHVPPGFLFSTGNNDFDNNLNVLGTGALVVLEQSNYEWQKTLDTWSSVGLDTSFPYNGVDDLLIDILVTGNDASNGSSSMHRNTRERLYATTWAGAPPTTGSVGSAALKIQIQMGCADATTYGPSCGGLALGFSGSPSLGGTLNVDAAGGAATQPIVCNISTFNSSPFPIDLTTFGFPGCFLLSGADADVPGVTDPNGNFTASLAVPNASALTGFRLYYQFVHINPNAPNGVALSNGGRTVLGPICP